MIVSFPCRVHCHLPKAACAFWSPSSIPTGNSGVPESIASKHVERWSDFYDSTGLTDYELPDGPFGCGLSLLLHKNPSVLRRGKASTSRR
jgi:hypothetical protein